MAQPGGEPETRGFLAERYWPGIDAADAQGAMRRIGAQIEVLTREGSPVQAIACTHVPHEQVVLCVVRATSADVVAELGRRADVPFDRIVDAVVYAPVDEGLGR